MAGRPRAPQKWQRSSAHQRFWLGGSIEPLGYHRLPGMHNKEIYIGCSANKRVFSYNRTGHVDADNTVILIRTYGGCVARQSKHGLFRYPHL
jgi:hypothetical protein